MARLTNVQVDQLLARWPVARLATVGADGRPHLVPIVFAACGDALWTPIDGKPKADGELARVRHLRTDPRVTLLLDRYSEDWRQLWWVRLEGRGSVCAAVGEAERCAERALREKYPQYRDTPLFRGAPTLIRIEIEHSTSWCADPALAPDG